jgi:hypothetical protein
MTESTKYIMYTPVHSDFLVYWTGRDIMKKYGGLPPNEKEYTKDVVEDFLIRLKSILKYGLWMKSRTNDDYIHVNQGQYLKPRVARLCFTELKISDSMLHADNFGPLGIGFKRFFVNNLILLSSYYLNILSTFTPNTSAIF